jgi:hypothetical protein
MGAGRVVLSLGPGESLVGMMEGFFHFLIFHYSKKMTWDFFCVGY